MKNLILIVSAVVLSFNTMAQSVQETVSKVISAKAAKGQLYDCAIKDNTISLTYLIKQSKKGLNIETYNFDKSTLKFVDMKADLVPDGTFKNKSGSAKGNKLLRLYPDLNGKPKLKLGYISYSYVNRARIENFVVTEELKPKGETGEKMYYIHHRTEEADNNKIQLFKGDEEKRLLNIGDVLLVGHVKVDGKPLYTQLSSQVIRAKDLSTSYKNDFELPYSYITVVGDNLPNGDIAVLLRAITIKDFPKPKGSKGLMEKFKLAEDYHFRYLQINPKGEVVQNVKLSINPPESGYYISADIISSDDGKEVMILGTTQAFKVLGPPLGRMAAPRSVFETHNKFYTKKAEKLFAIKVKDNQQVYSKMYAASAILSKPVLVHGAKQPKDIYAYVGKWGEKSPKALEMKNIDGKTILTMKIGWLSNHILQLSETGEMEANYIIGMSKGKVLSGDMKFRTIGNNNYIFFYEQPAVKKDATREERQKASEQQMGYVFKLNVKEKGTGKVVNLTPNATLDPYDPYFREEGNSIITLGNGRKKEIVLSRVILN